MYKSITIPVRILTNNHNKIPIGPAETAFEKEIFPFTFQK